MTNPTPKVSQYTILDSEYATITSVHHPLIRAVGFTNIMPEEIVVFEDGAIGQIMSFDEEGMDVMLFSPTPAKVGSKIMRTQQPLSFPIYQQMLGRVFDPLGRALDSTANTTTANKILEYKEIIIDVPELTRRSKIDRQLATGAAVVDLMLPLAHGQRQLILGDRKTGKTQFALKTAAAQGKRDSLIVIALIGKQMEDIKNTIGYLESHGIKDRSIIVASSAREAVSTIFLTPLAAITIAEHLRDQGEDVLVVLDDLSGHAKFYRELSLLARRFPGRDSYPGDIFYVHARLLERAGCFTPAALSQVERPHSSISTQPTPQRHNVAISCLPIVETVNSDLTDYIVSNLVSITDGHLLFSQQLFAQDQQPAIDTSLSVSRVGKQTQSPLARNLNQLLTSFISKYNKTKGLTHLASEISEQSVQIIKRGKVINNYFDEDDKVDSPRVVQDIMVGMIWQGWFDDAHKLELYNSRFNLSKHFRLGQEQTKFLNELVNVKDLEGFWTKLNASKQELLTLCQT